MEHSAASNAHLGQEATAGDDLPDEPEGPAKHGSATHKQLVVLRCTEQTQECALAKVQG